MASFFTESNRLDTDFGGDFALYNRNEFELTVHLDPQVPFGDIVDLLKDGYTVLWLDRECVLANKRFGRDFRHGRYCINVKLMSDCVRDFYLFQDPGTTERGAPLPALEYFLTRLANYELFDSFTIRARYDDDDFNTLDVSPDCFSHLLQTSRLHDNRFCSVTLNGISLTAEQTELLFTHATSPIFISLRYCSFHGPTLLLQLGSAALRREQNHAFGKDSHLDIILDGELFVSISCAELTALLSNQHLRGFYPFFDDDDDDIVPYEIVRKFVSALAANKISRLESLHFHENITEFEWDKEEEPSAWIDFWKAIEGHPSLKAVHLKQPPGLCQQSWWQPVAAAVKENPRLVRVDISERDNTPYWESTLGQHVGPLLERNRYRPKIAALCCSDPSTAAVLLGQAIVAIAHKKHMHVRCKREILQMLLEQLVLTGHGFGVGVGWVLGKKRALADTAVAVPNDADATKTEARVADGITASVNDNDL